MKVKDEAFKANQGNELTLSNIWYLISRYATMMQFNNVFHAPSEPFVTVDRYCAKNNGPIIALPFVKKIFSKISKKTVHSFFPTNCCSSKNIM